MDPIAQGLFGAASALLAVPPSVTRRTRWQAVLVGTVAGMAPDLDVLIRSADNPLLSIQYHRHFTHALAFIPFGALLVALGFWPFLKKFKWPYVWALLGWATHGVLDATTSYGTHLLWPFSNQRTSWSNMSIVEPFVWLLMLGTIIAAFSRFGRRGLLVGWLLTLSYFGWGYYQWRQIDFAMQQLATQRGHQIVLSEVKPTLGNLILWRTTYVANNGQIYVDGFRRGLTGHMRFYKGATLPLLNIERDLPWLKADSVQANDLAKFTFFSAGFVALKPYRIDMPQTALNNPNQIIVADMRYSMLPQSLEPLWGITLNPNNLQQHVGFGVFRQHTLEIRQKFWDMLKGHGGEVFSPAL
jgi:inner membrane protein